MIETYMMYIGVGDLKVSMIISQLMLTLERTTIKYGN
jgi:hypothetical protein